MAIAPPIKKKTGAPTPPISNVPPGPDGSPEVVAAQQALLSKTRGGPQYAKSDPRYGKTRPRTMPPMGGNQDPRSGGKPPQGPEQGGAVGTWEDPNYDKVRDGVTDQMGDFKGQIRDTGIRAMPMPAPGGIMDGNMGMKDPRAGGLNKRTGQWTPPDPAYLEGLKNGTIEPEWKKRERMWNTNGPIMTAQGPGMNGVGSYSDINKMSGQGGEQVPVGQAIGGQKPVYSNSGGGTLGSQNSDPSQGGPVGGGMPGRPGRQPLRPGMEYRPGGGQRPVGGRPQQPQMMLPDESGQAGPMSPAQMAQWSNGLGPYGGQDSGAYHSQAQFDQANPEWSAAGQSAAAAYQQQQGRPDPNDPRAAYYKQLSGLQ